MLVQRSYYDAGHEGPLIHVSGTHLNLLRIMTLSETQVHELCTKVQRMRMSRAKHHHIACDTFQMIFQVGEICD